MNKTPTISVSMPVYNAEKYVTAAIESILAQTFRDFEFLIIDDGSSDGSLAILQQYAERDQRIRLLSRPNTGYVVALNEMLQLAQGKYLARMDADDVALPERFSRQVEFLEKNPDVVCVGGAIECMDDKGRFLTLLKLPRNNDEIQQKALVGQVPLSHPAVIIRRNSLIEVGGYDEVMMPAEDLDLWLRLGEVGALANLEDSVLKYRLHANSVSAKDPVHQYNQAREACRRAWQRRGIEGVFEPTQPWRPGPDHASQHRSLLAFGWWAFGSGQRLTAITYGIKAIRSLPLEVEGWKILACALFKSIPRST